MSAIPVTELPHSKFAISHSTVSRLEKISGKKIIRNLDRVLNEVLDKIEAVPRE